MTLDELQDIINLPVADAVGALKNSDVDIPTWSTELYPQFDAMQHSIVTDFSKYPKKLNDLGVDEFRRIPIAKQEETVNKMAQSMFFKDVERKYDLGDADESLHTAKEALEVNLKTENNIDGTNLDRAKELFKSCEVATIWHLVEKPCIIKGLVSKYTLKHSFYSPALGYDLYPYIDANKNLIGISIGWKDANTSIQYLMTYLPGAVITYQSGDSGWEQTNFEKTGTDILTATYKHMEAPIWGGDSGTVLIEILEELTSKNQMYIDKNTVPTYVIYKGTGGRVSGVTESDGDRRRVVVVGENGFMKAVEWTGAQASISWQWNTILEQYYQQVQVFNNSPSAMQKTPMSADNKEIMLFDSKAKAKDMSSFFLPMFLEELNIVKYLMGVQFPSLKTALDQLSARSVIHPYSVRTKGEAAEYVNTAGDSMSLSTKVSVLGEVENVEDEVAAILEEQNADANNLL